MGHTVNAFTLATLRCEIYGRMQRRLVLNGVSIDGNKQIPKKAASSILKNILKTYFAHNTGFIRIIASVKLVLKRIKYDFIVCSWRHVFRVQPFISVSSLLWNCSFLFTEGARSALTSRESVYVDTILKSWATYVNQTIIRRHASGSIAQQAYLIFFSSPNE